MPATSRPSGQDFEEEVSLLGKSPSHASETTSLISDHNPTNADARKSDPPASSRFVLLFTSLCLLVTSVLNSVFFKKMTNAMVNNAWFLSQLSTVVYGTFLGLSHSTDISSSCASGCRSNTHALTSARGHHTSNLSII